MTEARKALGRPKNATPSRRMGGFRLSALEGEGLDWLVQEAQAHASLLGGDASDSSVLRKLIKDELKRRKWPKAHLLDAPAPGRPDNAAPATPELERHPPPAAPKRKARGSR